MSKPKKKIDKKTQSYKDWLQKSAVRVGRVHFVLVLIYVTIVILYDAFGLITDDILLQRWIMASATLAVSAALWYIARSRSSHSRFYASLIWSFIILDIIFASFNVYTQRGMASRAVFLYVLPIIVSSLFLSRAAVYMSATLAAAAYSLTAVWYYVANPSEGYRIELYGEVGFYSALFFIVAALLWDIMRSKNTDSS